jgi:PAS domain S-box-containing protein
MQIRKPGLIFNQNELEEYDILDSAEEKSFDDLVDLASLICDCPVSTITFVDSKRQWFKARKNMPERETPVEVSFCAQAIQLGELLVVEDAFRHEHFSSYPNVTGGLKIRFYAGSPVRSSSGKAIGTISVIDTKPKKLSQDQLDALENLSRQVSHLLELRLLNKRLRSRADRLLASAESYKEYFDNAPNPQWIFDQSNKRFLAVNRAALEHYGYSEQEFLELSLFDITDINEQRFMEINEELVAKGKLNLLSTHRKKDGREIVVDVSIAFIVYEGKRVVITTITDVSEKLQLQVDLLREKKEVKEKVQVATLTAQTQEREYLGRELHDNINQMLASIKLYLDIAARDDAMRIELIYKCKEFLTITMNEVRSLSHKLVNTSSKGLNLVEAMEELLAPYYLNKAFTIDYSSSGNLNGLSVDVKISLLRIIQEGIQNIAKYAEAKKVRLELNVADNIKLLIADDGKGFDPATRKQGIGIRNIHERTQKLKGTVEMNSAIGRGCMIKIQIPLPE